MLLPLLLLLQGLDLLLTLLILLLLLLLQLLLSTLLLYGLELLPS